MALALTLGLGATAQNTMFDWEDTDDTYYFDAASIGMFDFTVFTDLFDMTNDVGSIGEWTSVNDFFDEIRDSSISISLPGSHGGTDDVNAPLGSGILLLVGFGAAYAATKRRKEA